MYRVLVVDDEEPVLDSFTYVISSFKDDFEVCAVARSGEEAVELIYRHRPEVVFMDVQMPGISGIDAIEQVRSDLPDTLFILATAYERFDIAKRVIPLNVFAYLVKPVTKTKLIAQLGDAAHHLDMVKEKRTRQVRETELLKVGRDSIRTELIRKILQGQLTPDAWGEHCKSAGLDEEKFSMFVGISHNTSRGDLEQAGELLQYKFPSITAVVGGQVLAFLEHGVNADLVASALRPLDGKIEYGYSSVTGQQNIPAIHAKLTADLTVGIQTASPFELVRELMTIGAKESGSLIEEICGELFDVHGLSGAKLRICEMFALCNMQQRGDENFCASSHFENLRSEGEIIDRARVLLRSILERREELSRKELPDVLRRAIQYIQEHYKKPLQLGDVAQECNVSLSHLSRLFSRQLGIGFIDYLNRKRLDESQKLLSNGGISVKHVAMQVGYQDPNYFSRLYRRYFGVAPSESRGEGEG